MERLNSTKSTTETVINNTTQIATQNAIQNTIQRAINYIEENLKNDINVTKTAKAVGYSEYHFIRIFKKIVGLTPADYIRKRRISEIADYIQNESRTENCSGKNVISVSINTSIRQPSAKFISDIAFEYGFNSKENFTRAFKTEHSILPTELKRCKNSLKLYGCFEIDPKYIEPQYDIKEIAPLSVIAYPSDEPVPSNFWNKYNVNGCSGKLTGGISTLDYGICKWNFEKNKLDYWIGVAESDALGDKSGTVRIKLSGGLYAAFQTPPATQFDFVSSIHRTWKYINEIWLPQNIYEKRDDYEYECYIEKSRLFYETVYIPIKLKTNS